MEPLGEEWVAELREQIKDHMQFIPMHMRQVKLEAQYNKVVASLDPEQQKIIKDFEHINQKLEVFLTREAYLCGIQVGERRTKRQNSE